MRRRLRWMFVSVLAFILVLPSLAFGEYLGSDPFQNIGPADRIGGLASRHTLDKYGLDYHVDFGVDNPGAIVQEIQQALAQSIWDLISNIVKLTIDCFAWAFSTDLLNGPHGALTAVAAGTQSLNNHLEAQGWLYFAIVCLAGWGMFKALGQRQLGAALSGFATSLACAVLAMAIINNPVETVGNASKFSNTVSQSMLTGFGTVGTPEEGRQAITDHLFKMLIYDPWVVLEFGGMRHCVDTDNRDENGYPEPVATDDPRRDVCRDHVTPNSAGYGGYAERFLRYRVGTNWRNDEYEALRKGETPEVSVPNNPLNCPRAACTPEQIHENNQAQQIHDEQFAGYKVDKADSPAVDIQQAGGARSRLRAVLLMTIGALGIVLLFGRLSVTVLIAQIVALGLLGLAPVALIFGLFPMGHRFFKWWATRLATALFIKVIYAVIIAVLVALSAALMYATEDSGFLVSFSVQCIVFWAVYLKRNLIITELSEAIGGKGHSTKTAALTAAALYSATRPYRAMTKGRSRSSSSSGGGRGGGRSGSGGDDDDVTDNDQVLDDNGPDTTEHDDYEPPIVPRERFFDDDPAEPAPARDTKRGGRRKRRYKVTKDPDELAAMNGGDPPTDANGNKVTWALLGSEPPEPPETGADERGDADPDVSPDDTRDHEPSPRELHEEASVRLGRKRRKVRDHRPVAEPPEDDVRDLWADRRPTDEEDS